MVSVSSALHARNAQLLLNQPGAPYDEAKAHTTYKSGVFGEIAIRASAADRAEARAEARADHTVIPDQTRQTWMRAQRQRGSKAAKQNRLNSPTTSEARDQSVPRSDSCTTILHARHRTG